MGERCSIHTEEATAWPVVGAGTDWVQTALPGNDDRRPPLPDVPAAQCRFRTSTRWLGLAQRRYINKRGLDRDASP